eukprot:364915-Chlamydomonas_euryale.AAC.22
MLRCPLWLHVEALLRMEAWKGGCAWRCCVAPCCCAWKYCCAWKCGRVVAHGDVALPPVVARGSIAVHGSVEGWLRMEMLRCPLWLRMSLQLRSVSECCSAPVVAGIHAVGVCGVCESLPRPCGCSCLCSWYDPVHPTLAGGDRLHAARDSHAAYNLLPS